MTKFRLLLKGKIRIGKNVKFGKNIVLHPPNYLLIGDNVYIGTQFLTEVNMEIGNDVLFSTRVSCIGNDHKFSNPDESIIVLGRTLPNKIVIEGDNLIGFGSILIGNIKIGKGCIIGAGSVVTKDLPPYTICAGVPARPIKKRFS